MNEIERSRLDSDLLRTFLAVAETANITRAGEVLGRTQSAVSVQIRKLEEILSAQLFHRRPRGMSLTEAGRILLPEARKILGDLEHIGDLFATPLFGKVRVGVPDDYGTDVLQRVLATFAARHPNVEVFVRCGFSVGFPEAIRHNELDLALYNAAPPERAGEVLMCERTLWVASPDLNLGPAETVPLALFDRECWWHDAATQGLDQASRSYRVAYSSESAAGVRAAVTAGLAVGVLAESTIDPTLRILSEKEGFPELPPSALVLLRHSSTPNAACLAMEAAISGTLAAR